MSNRTKMFAKLLCGSTALSLMVQMPASAQDAPIASADEDSLTTEDGPAEIVVTGSLFEDADMLSQKLVEVADAEAAVQDRLGEALNPRSEGRFDIHKEA